MFFLRQLRNSFTEIIDLIICTSITLWFGIACLVCHLNMIISLQFDIILPIRYQQLEPTSQVREAAHFRDAGVYFQNLCFTSFIELCFCCQYNLGICKQSGFLEFFVFLLELVNPCILGMVHLFQRQNISRRLQILLSSRCHALYNKFGHVYLCMYCIYLHTQYVSARNHIAERHKMAENIDYIEFITPN